MDFREIRQLAEGTCIPKGDKGDAVVSKGREGRESSRLLATTGATCGDKDACELAVQLALLPELASRIPEGLQITLSPSQ